MIAQRNYTNILFIGIFLLCYAQSAHIILGSMGKYVALVGGFFFLALLAYQCRQTKAFSIFFIFSLILYILFMILASVNGQRVFSTVNVLFGLVCFALLNFGFIFSKNQHYFTPVVHHKIIVGIAIMTMVGVIFFIRFQSQLAVLAGTSGRGLGEDSELNPVGLAYVHGLLFLISFALYQKQKHLGKFLKVLLILAQIAALVAIIMTQSRGALVFLGVFILAYFYFSFKLDKKFLSNILKFGFLVFFFGLAILALSSSVPVVEDKINGLKYRFTSLFNSIDDTTVVDQSSEVRMQGYNEFFEDIDKIILIGQANYKPYPHNQFIEIIMRWGMVGLPLLFFSLYCLLKSYKLLRLRHRNLGVITFVVIALFIFSYLQSMTSLSLEINRLMWLGFGFVCGLPLRKE